MIDIISKINKTKENFDNFQNIINERLLNIKKTEQEINELIDEQKRIQGEYRLLVSIGQELKLLDTEGNPLNEEIDLITTEQEGL